MPPEGPHHYAAEISGQPSWIAPFKPTVPDHELLRRIGGGSYGDVWLARTTVGTWRAVKVVFRDRFLDSRPYEREFNGIQKFEPLSRSNEGFIDILQIGRNDAEGYFYYVMELADDALPEAKSNQSSVTGNQSIESEVRQPLHTDHCSLNTVLDPSNYVPKTLSKVLLQRGRLPVAECLEMGLTLNLGLAHLHRAGLIHRDIKPSNIIFVGGVPKLADIGLVIEMAEARSFVGTEGFIPPEGPNSPQADLYSLGKVLYEAGMGKDRKDFPEPFTQIAEVSDSAQLLEFNGILLKACAANREQRYQSAEEMNADLALLQSGGSVRSRHQFNRQLRIAKQVGAAAIAATLVIGAAWFWQRRQTERVTHLAEEKTSLASENKRLAAEAQNNERAARQNLYAADINLAHQALIANNRTQVRELLQNHVPKLGQPDLRGYEWRYLWEQSRSEQLFSLTGPTNEGRAVAFSPEGQYLATGCADGTTKITALDTRREIASLNVTGEVKSISFCANRDLLAVATKNASSLWDTRSLKPIREIPEYGWFSPDGRFLLTDAKAPLLVSGTMFTCRMVLWDMESGTVTNTLELPEAWKHLWMTEPGPWGAFAQNGKFVAIIFADAIRVFSIPDFLEIGVLARKFSAGQSSSVFVAISPDNNTLAASEPTGRGIQLWDVAQQREGKALPGHAEGVLAVSFSADGSLLASCGEDQTIKLWDVITGELIRGFRGKANNVAFSPNGNLLATARSSEGGVDVWDVTAKPRQESFREPLGPLGFSLQSGLVALGKDLKPLVIDPATLRVTNFSGLNLTNSRPCPYRTPEITSKHATNTERWYDPYLGNLSRDGRTVALFDLWEQSMDLWDMQNGNLLCTVEASRPWVSFAPKRQLVATAVANSSVTVWQLPSGTRKWVFPAGFWQALAFSPDEDLVISDDGKQKQLWRIEGDEVKPMLTFAPTPNGGDGIAFSPDGRLVATGEAGGVIRLWEMPSARDGGVFKGHTRSVLALAFSPDGRTLASMCDDRTVRLWHVATRRELLRFQAPKDDYYYFNLAFSPDGRALAARRVDNEGPITWLWYAPTLADIGSKQAGN